MKAWESGVMVADLFKRFGEDDMTRGELLSAAHEARTEGSIDAQRNLLRAVRTVDAVDDIIRGMIDSAADVRKTC